MVESVRDPGAIPGRLRTIKATADAYLTLYGKAAEPIAREALAGRLEHEAHLGGLLKGTPLAGTVRAAGVVPDDTLPLPDGVSRDLSSHAQTLHDARTVRPDWFSALTDGIRDGTRRRAVKAIYLEARRIVAGRDGIPALPEGLILGKFQDVGDRIPAESVALVFTDPPYDRASLPNYEALAPFAARVLLPGGSLVTYAPTYALPEVFAALGNALRYWWTLAVLHGGGRSLMTEYGIRVGYKPLLWYTKGGRHDKQAIIADVIESGQAKAEHEWEQSVIEATAVIEALTRPGDLVVDPMAGSGTTLLAAASCGRSWRGIEEKAETIALAKQRLENHPERSPR
jgi:site-specific DNA-methyltransferase (adenine-specific)